MQTVKSKSKTEGIIINGKSETVRIPWEDRPNGSKDVIWRYSDNPVVPADIIPCSNSVFNSAAVPFKDGFAGVFRCDSKSRALRIHAGKSKDGINWQIEHEPIEFELDVPEYAESYSRYDPRVV